MNSKKVLGPILLSLSACIWGGMFVVVKLIVEKIHPLQLVWLRYIVAIIFLIGFSVLKKEKWHINWHDIKLVFLIGIIGNTISIVFQETGTWLSSAQTGGRYNVIDTYIYDCVCVVVIKREINKSENYLCSYGNFGCCDDCRNSSYREIYLKGCYFTNNCSTYLGLDVCFDKKGRYL